MNWNNVFDGHKKFWTNISEVIEFLPKTGYMFFSWNGRVYDQEGRDIGVLTETLK